MRVPNPIRAVILGISLLLARLGLVDETRARRTVDLAWPRIVTGLARMSKNAVDIAMVGIAVGPAAIAGVGFASPFWSAGFTFGGGVATGTIALVSQAYGGDAMDRVGRTVRSSVLVVLCVMVPLAAAMWAFAVPLIDLLTGDPTSIRHGATYLRIVAVGLPFAGVNLVAGRALIGADDAWSPMVLRAGGATTNIAINAVLIFGFGMGVAGAAIGTVAAAVLVTVAFTAGFLAGRLPGVGAFPFTVSPRGQYANAGIVRDIVTIGTPATARRAVWTGARFPMLAIVALFGPAVVAAYVISRRVWSLINTPGWGFSLAASSLVGQSLGAGDEPTAEAYGHEIVRIAVVTYAVSAGLVLAFAEPIVRAFVRDPGGATVPVGAALVSAAALAVILRGIGGPYAGALDATGDTRWPFYSRAIGMLGVAIPVAYLGATTALGLFGLYLAYLAQSLVPAVINAYRFRTGKWKAISRRYRPASAPAGE